MYLTVPQIHLDAWVKKYGSVKWNGNWFQRFTTPGNTIYETMLLLWPASFSGMCCYCKLDSSEWKAWEQIFLQEALRSIIVMGLKPLCIYTARERPSQARETRLSHTAACLIKRKAKWSRISLHFTHVRHQKHWVVILFCPLSPRNLRKGSGSLRAPVPSSLRLGY